MQVEIECLTLIAAWSTESLGLHASVHSGRLITSKDSEFKLAMFWVHCRCGNGAATEQEKKNENKTRELKPTQGWGGWPKKASRIRAGTQPARAK